MTKGASDARGLLWRGFFHGQAPQAHTPPPQSVAGVLAAPLPHRMSQPPTLVQRATPLTIRTEHIETLVQVASQSAPQSIVQLLALWQSAVQSAPHARSHVVASWQVVWQPSAQSP